MMENPWNEKLLIAVSKGQTGVVLHYLGKGANVNHRDKKDGKTPLLKAAQKRNYVMQKLLLANGAKISSTDQEGLTALHYEAGAGDVDTVMLLLAYQASVDTKDYYGNTALHYAAKSGRTMTSDLLVFCGANGRAKNNDRISCQKIAKTKELKKMLIESDRIQDGIQHNDITLQTAELQPNKLFLFDKLGLTIKTNENFDNDGLSFLCRRIRPEYGDNNIKPNNDKKELLISDTFEFRHSMTLKECWVTVEIPMYDCPNSFEDVYIKTDKKKELCPLTDLTYKILRIRSRKDKDHPGELLWSSLHDIDLNDISSFCLVTVPKTENIPYDNSRKTIFTSDIDAEIQLVIPPQTFQVEKSQLTLEVVPCPLYQEKIFGKLQSSTHFYDIQHAKKDQPKHDCELRMPIPLGYMGGTIVLLGSNLNSNSYQDEEEEDINAEDMADRWEIYDQIKELNKCIIKAPVPHFSITTGVEIPQGVTMTSTEIKTSTDKLFRQSSLRRQMVAFIVMLKPLGNAIFSVLVEVANTRNVSARKNHWLQNKYVETSTFITEETESVPGKKYKIDLSANVKFFRDIHEILLEYHPYRCNYQEFEVQLLNKDIDDIDHTGIVRIRDFNGDLLHEVKILLEGKPEKEEIAESSKEFFSDAFLKQIAERLDTEWVHFCLLMGLSYETVKEIKECTKKKSLSVLDKKTKTFKLWRAMVRFRGDKGIPDMIFACRRMNRDDIQTMITDRLDNRIRSDIDTQQDGSSQQDKFSLWLLTVKDHPEIIYKTRAPDLMSDQMVGMMVESYRDDLVDIRKDLSLDEDELASLFEDGVQKVPDIAIIKMIIMLREKDTDPIVSLRVLINALQKHNKEKILNWIIKTTRSWMEENMEDNDPFIEEIGKILEDVQGSLPQEKHEPPVHEKQKKRKTDTDEENEKLRTGDVAVNEDDLPQKTEDALDMRYGNDDKQEEIEDEDNIDIYAQHKEHLRRSYNQKSPDPRRSSFKKHITDEPGPGSYFPEHARYQNDRLAPAWSMSRTHRFREQDWVLNNTPGPMYHTGSRLNAPTSAFSYSRSTGRLKYDVNKSPGPYFNAVDPSYILPKSPVYSFSGNREYKEKISHALSES